MVQESFRSSYKVPSTARPPWGAGPDPDRKELSGFTAQGALKHLIGDCMQGAGYSPDTESGVGRS